MCEGCLLQLHGIVQTEMHISTSSCLRSTSMALKEHCTALLPSETKLQLPMSTGLHIALADMSLVSQRNKPGEIACCNHMTFSDLCRMLACSDLFAACICHICWYIWHCLTKGLHMPVLCASQMLVLAASHSMQGQLHKCKAMSLHRFCTENRQGS